jgi:hypothetical protein
MGEPTSSFAAPDARTADGDQMDIDLRAIAADLRELHTALDADIADRREPHPRPPDRVTRSLPARRL